MNLTGQISGLARDFASGKPVVSLQINENIDGIEELNGKQLEIILKIYREKRSRDANAYFHVLCGKIAEKTGTSMNRAKNMLLQRYGQLFYYEGQTLDCYFPDILDVEDDPENHFLPTGEVKAINGSLCRKYYLIRGSHTYSTAEMSHLIDGTIAEAKVLGIETMTPDQLTHLYDLWEMEHGQAAAGKISPR